MKQIICMCIFLVCSCKNPSQSEVSIKHNRNVAVANEFIDSFYSFNSDKLNSILSAAEESKPSILYYQGWAEGGNYEIVERHPCVARNDSLVTCPVTVKDDLISALEIDFNVTDTFHITVLHGQIIMVTTSSNDPPLFYEARDWVQQNLFELIEEPCKGIWKDGTTPGECVRAMVKGYANFIASKRE